MKEKLQRFMMGRYGVDAFGKFLLYTALVLWGINLFINNVYLHSWALLLLVYSYFRMFSRNVTKRYQENVKYLQIKNKLLSKIKQPSAYRIYRCPTCKQKIRIPKGKGRICITCPKCKTEFVKRS